MSTGRQKVPVIAALDGFRAYAIFVVVGLHLLAVAGALTGERGTAFGTLVWGVAGNVLDIFFILSGFLLFLPVVARGGLGSVRDYARARFLRLFPAYWLALAISAVVAIGLSWIPAPSAGEVAVHLTAMQMPARVVDPLMPLGFTANGPLWMISVIVGFYLVLPLIARSYLRHPIAGLMLAIGVTLAWKAAAPQLGELLAPAPLAGWEMQLVIVDQLPAWAASFGLGMTGAWAYVRRLERGPVAIESGRALALLGVGLAAFGVCAYLYGREAASINAAFAGAAARENALLGLAYTVSRAAVMAAILLGPLWLRRPFELPIARQLAGLSYGLYLIHLPVALFVGVALLELPSDGSVGAVLLWFAVVISISLVYAALSRRLLERPLIERSRRKAAARAASIQSRGRAREAPSHPRGEARVPARSA